MTSRHCSAKFGLIGAVSLALVSCAQVETKACFKDDYRIEKYLADRINDLPEVQQRNLNADERRKLLTKFNETMPLTGFNYDSVMVFWAEGGTFSIVIYIEDGCVWQSMRLPTWQFEYWIQSK